MKGQKSRSGVAIKGYEGGQMPLYQRLPKRGFTKPNRKAFSVVNLGLIQKFIDEGKLTGDVTEDSLIASGLVRRKLDGIRVLAKAHLLPKSQSLLRVLLALQKLLLKRLGFTDFVADCIFCRIGGCEQPISCLHNF